MGRYHRAKPSLHLCWVTGTLVAPTALKSSWATLTTKMVPSDAVCTHGIHSAQCTNVELAGRAIAIEMNHQNDKLDNIVRCAVSASVAACVCDHGVRTQRAPGALSPRTYCLRGCQYVLDVCVCSEHWQTWYSHNPLHLLQTVMWVSPPAECVRPRR